MSDRNLPTIAATERHLQEAITALYRCPCERDCYREHNESAGRASWPSNADGLCSSCAAFWHLSESTKALLDWSRMTALRAYEAARS